MAQHSFPPCRRAADVAVQGGAEMALVGKFVLPEGAAAPRRQARVPALH